MIKKFIQGEATDRELFSNVGRWLVLKKVQDELGMAVTAEDGDIWHLFYNREFPLGFSVSRPQKNGQLHLRFLYFERESAGEALIKAVLKLAQETETVMVHTNDRDTATIWPKSGFKAQPKPNHKPGNFVRWEKEIA